MTVLGRNATFPISFAASVLTIIFSNTSVEASPAFYAGHYWSDCSRYTNNRYLGPYRICIGGSRYLVGFENVNAFITRDCLSQASFTYTPKYITRDEAYNFDAYMCSYPRPRSLGEIMLDNIIEAGKQCYDYFGTGMCGNR